MKKQAILILMLTAVIFLTADFPGAEQKPGAVTQAQWELEIQRLKELYQLTDLYGDKIWAGFDMRKIPIGINYNSIQEILINHPKPPQEFREFKDCALDGQTVMIRDGCTSYIGVGGGGALPINRIRTAYTQTPDKKITTEKYLLTLLHEGFHIFQQHIREESKAPRALPQMYDIKNSAAIALENTILFAAIEEENTQNLDELAKMFVAVRSQRQDKLPEPVRRQENVTSFAEGTAHYAEAKLSQLLHQAGPHTSPLTQLDPTYKGFTDAGKFYRDYLEGILPPKDRIITLGHERYQNGMAQAFLLDKVRPNWKSEMAALDMTQFTLLKRQFPLDEKEKNRLAAAARKKFAYKKILALQKNLIKDRLTASHYILDTPGQRYHLYYLDNPGKLKFKLRTPIYELYANNLTKTQLKKASPPGQTLTAKNFLNLLIYPKGIELLEMGDLLFKCREIPVIDWCGEINYLEWIDNSPAKDKSAVKIQADKQEKDIYTNLLLETDGFTLRVGRARILWSKKIVEIHPLPPLPITQETNPRSTARTLQ